MEEILQTALGVTGPRHGVDHSWKPVPGSTVAAIVVLDHLGGLRQKTMVSTVCRSRSHIYTADYRGISKFAAIGFRVLQPVQYL